MHFCLSPLVFAVFSLVFAGSLAYLFYAWCCFKVVLPEAKAEVAVEMTTVTKRKVVEEIESEPAQAPVKKSTKSKNKKKKAQAKQE